MTPPWLRTVRLLRARRLLDFDGQRMPGYDDASALAWQEESAPALVVFISHRWRATSQPDPDGRTLRAIQQVLLSLEALACGLDPLDATPAPDLRQPGMLQASVLLYRMLERCELEGQHILDRLALFFDFSCMPQGHAADEQDDLQNGLAGLPAMIPDSIVTLLALRQPGDDYASRAWCVAESVLSLQYDADRAWIYTFPLRMDLEPTGFASIAFEPLRASIDDWADKICGRPQITEDEFRHWLHTVQLCVDWHSQAQEEAMRMLHHSPGIAQQSFQLWIAVTTRLAEGGERIVDVGPLVCEVVAAAGLRCTNPDDVLPTALLILAGLRWEELNRDSGLPKAPAAPGVDFWRLCFSRYLQGRPLRAAVRPRPSMQEGQLTMPHLSLVADSAPAARSSG